MSSYLDLLIAARAWAKSQDDPSFSVAALDALKRAAISVTDNMEGEAARQALAALPIRLVAPKSKPGRPEWNLSFHSMEVHPEFEPQHPVLVRTAMRAVAARRELAMRIHVSEGRPDIGDGHDDEPVEPWPPLGWPRRRMDMDPK